MKEKETMRFPEVKKLVLKLVLFWLLTFLCAQPLHAAQNTSVFVLHSYSQEYPWTEREHKGFMRRLAAAPEVFTICVEYLDTKRVPYTSGYADLVADHLAQKYAGFQPQAIYVTDDNALLFALSHLSRIFPNAPVFFSGINDYKVKAKLPSGRITGVFERKDIHPNLNLMHLLAPEASDIIIVGDESETFQSIRREIVTELEHHPKIKASFLSSGRIDQLVESLHGRPERFVFLTTLGTMTDATGHMLTLPETISAIVQAGKFIILSMEDVYLYPGVLGGYVTSGLKQGNIAADMVLRYLNGTAVSDIPPIEASPNEYIFNGTELNKTGLKLPPEIAKQAIILNPLPTFYERNIHVIVRTFYVLVLLFVLSLSVLLYLMFRKNRQIAESEAKHRILFEVSPDAYLILADDVIIDCNRATEVMLRGNREQIVGQTPETLSPEFQPDGRKSSESAAEKIAEVQRTGSKTFEWMNRRLDGSDFWGEVYIALITMQGRPVLFVSWRDITERKQAELKIKESSDFLENIFKTSADGILVTARRGIIKMVNDSIEKMLGYPKDELIGKAITELSPPGDIYEKRGIEFITRLYEEGFISSFENQYLSKDGHFIEVEISAALLKDSQGGHTGAIAILRDITYRKQAEEEKKKIEAQLSRSEKMETVGLLAGGVAHDLNNMLGAIVGYPELLLDDLSLDSPLRPAIKAIKESGERAAAIVQDLLTLTRRGVAVHEIINLNVIVQKYFESREWEKLKEFHPAITVKQRLDPALLNLVGSPVHVSKVIANLVSNAAEAMPQGGTIEIATATRHLDAPLKGYDKITEGDYSVLSVSDNGIGIPEEDLQRIFEPFYTKKIMGRSGTGLGMSVVWGTVKDHGGHIDIKSRQGEGTTMTLYFPATRKELTEQETAFSLERFIGSGETILVIDDIESQRDIARAILTKLRYRVEAAASGEEAVAYLKQNNADLLVLDMIMDPGMDGLETYQKILELHPHQKAIIASGYSETDRVRQAQILGAGAYVKKPYTIEKLGQAVKNELHK